MVKSNINENIQYIEKRTIDPEDKGHASSMYVIEVFDIEILIVLGKPKYTYSGKGVVYYPIYVVADNKIKSQIGVFEAKLSNSIRLVDDEGDIDIDKLGEPIIYSFVNKKFLQSAKSNPYDYLQQAKPSKEVEPEKESEKDKESKSKQKDKGDSSDSDSDSDDDVFSLKVSKNKISSAKENTDREISDGVFIIDSNFRRPETIIEETEKDAEEIRKAFHPSSSNTWIENFMKNNNYGIIDNEGSGDCLFAVVRDAYAHIGYKTTVSKLRAVVASHLTLDKFEADRQLYLTFEARKNEVKSNMKDIKENIDEYKARVRKLSKSNNKEDMQKLVDAAKELAEKYEVEKKELKNIQKDQLDYSGDMSELDTIDKYREYIKTSNYWADAWAISVLEASLKMKLVIFSEEAYNNSNNDAVLNCGIISSSLENKQFEPEYYIMTTYSGSHYRLITYKNKHIFGYKEIPYNVKILIVNKCLEKNAGIYYKIQDFRNFKSMLGLNPDEGGIEPDDEDEIEEDTTYGNLYNKNVVFVFHEKSLASAKPGMGTGESIEKDRRADFTSLGKIPHWRRKLHDSWTESPFRLDDHTWASVEHYVQASRFKKGFPDFYVQFSLDNPSELSRNPDTAIAAADIRKSKHKSLRPANVKEDVDYSLGRNLEEREAALRAKFTQHDDMKHLLYNTRDALLKEYLRRKPAKKDILLMKIRDEIISK